MNVLRPKRCYKQRITREQFDNCVATPAYEIKRIGRRIYIVGTNSRSFITQDCLDNLSRQIKQSPKPMKIVTTGLSKAQVGRIVSYIKTATAKRVFIKKIDSSDSNRVLSYEILVTGEAE